MTILSVPIRCQFQSAGHQCRFDFGHAGACDFTGTNDITDVQCKSLGAASGRRCWLLAGHAGDHRNKNGVDISNETQTQGWGWTYPANQSGIYQPPPNPTQPCSLCGYETAGIWEAITSQALVASPIGHMFHRTCLERVAMTTSIPALANLQLAVTELGSVLRLFSEVVVQAGSVTTNPSSTKDLVVVVQSNGFITRLRPNETLDLSVTPAAIR